MKPILILCTLLLCYSCTYAQKVIDEKYKKPSLAAKNSTSLVKSATINDLLIKVYGKSESDKVWDKCNAEFNAFNQNGDEIWIYADEFFNGEKKILKIGNYTLLGSATTSELGSNWNDKISSMLIPLSLKVTLFMDDKFMGMSAQASGFGVTNMETGSKGFKGDYYTFKSLGKYSKGGIYFVSNQGEIPMILASDNISSLKIFR